MGTSANKPVVSAKALDLRALHDRAFDAQVDRAEAALLRRWRAEAAEAAATVRVWDRLRDHANRRLGVWVDD